MTHAPSACDIMLHLLLERRFYLPGTLLRRIQIDKFTDNSQPLKKKKKQVKKINKKF
jgi:hypothetical protein